MPVALQASVTSAGQASAARLHVYQRGRRLSRRSWVHQTPLRRHLRMKCRTLRWPWCLWSRPTLGQLPRRSLKLLPPAARCQELSWTQAQPTPTAMVPSCRVAKSRLAMDLQFRTTRHSGPRRPAVPPLRLLQQPAHRVASLPKPWPRCVTARRHAWVGRRGNPLLRESAPCGQCRLRPRLWHSSHVPSPRLSLRRRQCLRQCLRQYLRRLSWPRRPSCLRPRQHPFRLPNSRQPRVP